MGTRKGEASRLIEGITRLFLTKGRRILIFLRSKATRPEGEEIKSSTVKERGESNSTERRGDKELYC